MTSIDAATFAYHDACIEYVERVLTGHIPLGSAEALDPVANARQNLLRLEKEADDDRD